MTDLDGVRIAFADDIVQCLRDGHGWLTDLDALPDGSVSRPRIKPALDALEALTEDASAFVEETAERYSDVLGHCPVVLTCSCRSLTTIRGVLFAASILVRDATYELTVKRDRLQYKREQRRELRSLNRLLDDHRPRQWSWHRVASSLESIREDVGATPLAPCGHCGARDVFSAAPGGTEAAAAAAAGAACIAWPGAVVAQLRRAEGLAAALIENERGLRAAFRHLLLYRWKGHAFRDLQEELQDASVDLERLLEDARRVRPELLDRCQVAIPCTCPSLSTLHGLNRAVRALTETISAQFTLVKDAPGSPDRSALEKKRLERITSVYANDYRIASHLEWVWQEAGRRDFTECDRCGALDRFRVRFEAA